MTERKLTITSLCQFDNRRWGKPNVVPFLRLSGLWLEKVGFHIGDKVSVQVESGKLVLVPLDAERPLSVDRCPLSEERPGSGIRGPGSERAGHKKQKVKR